MKRILLACAMICLLLPLYSPPSAQAAGKRPIVVIYMENHERSAIVNNSSAPYMNSLLSKGLNFTHYYGVTHPSLPNYLAIANGSTNGKAGTDSISAGQLTATPTVWSQLSGAGVSWKVYEESMPSTCYGGTSSGEYQLKHNPATPFHQVFSSSTLCNNVQPYHTGVPLAKFTFIAPNMCNDTHDCSVATGDNWLKANVPGMLAANALVIITYDEGSTSAGINGTSGGGNIYTVLVGNGIAARTITSQYNHYSILARIESRFGLTKLNGANNVAQLPLK